MIAIRRLKGAGRAILGLRPWPVVDAPLPKTFEDQLFTACVRTGDVVYDVGANNGEVAAYLARLTGPTGSVVAFEPVIDTYRMMCGTIQADGYAKAPVMTMPFGLSDADGEAEVSLPEGRHALASLGRPAAWDSAYGQLPVVQRRCEFRTLDGVMAARDLPVPDFLKVDVEGAELLVFRGAAALLGSSRPPLILCEIFAPWERPFGYGPAEVLELLASHGYRFLFACPEGLVRHDPTPDRPVPEGYRQGYNVVAYQPSRHAERIDRLSSLEVGRGALLPMTPAPVPNE